MAAHRSLLLRLSIRPAGKLSHCKHNKKHEITKGEVRFVVKEPGAAAGEFGYCAECAREMIDRAHEELTKLRASLSGAAPESAQEIEGREPERRTLVLTRAAGSPSEISTQ